LSPIYVPLQPIGLQAYLVAREVAVPPWTAASFAFSKAKELCTHAKHGGMVNAERRIALYTARLALLCGQLDAATPYFARYHSLCTLMLGIESEEALTAAVWAADSTAHPAFAESGLLHPMLVFRDICKAADLNPPQTMLSRIAAVHPASSEAVQPPADTAVWAVCGRGPACATLIELASERSVASSTNHAALLHDLFAWPDLVRHRDWTAACPPLPRDSYIGAEVELLQPRSKSPTVWVIATLNGDNCGEEDAAAQAQVDGGGKDDHRDESVNRATTVRCTIIERGGGGRHL
jgi:hypothetical protein